MASIEYYAPLPGFNRRNRDIDVSDLRFARAWHFPQGWEFQLGAVAFRAEGTRTQPSFSPNPPLQPSNALALGLAPLLRWNFLQFRRWRSFADAEEDTIFSTRDFPAEGTRYNGYFRGGGGASFRVNDSYWVEASFHWAHVSNGRSLSENPIWNGRGFSLGLRRTFYREPESPQSAQHGEALLPLFRKADENAWITNFDYYAPLPGFNRRDRDIDVEIFRIDRAWHFPRGLEFHFGGLMFRASGTRIDPSWSAPLERSDALGGGFGPLGRWNFLQVRRCRFFVNGASDFILTNNAFPAGARKSNFFSHGGGGASFRLDRSYWLEAGFRWAHLSSGRGVGRDNPGWNGQGVSLGLRHTF